MIIATSGKGGSINYSRIISSNPLYSVDSSESKTYRDPSLDPYKHLFGLFIIDKDNLVSLIWDSSNFMTEVATLNLAIPSITYKLSLPSIVNMFTSVFKSRFLYYTPTWNSVFYKDCFWD